MQKMTGLILFLAGTIILMGILIAEIFYPPGYSISQNMISNLGSTPPPDSVIHQPSALIFDNSMIASGVLLFIAAYFSFKVYGKKVLFVFMNVLALGTLGVGIFPAFHLYTHPISALFAFAGGGLAAIQSSRVVTSPFKYIVIILGFLNLLFLFLGLVMPDLVVPYLGRGGTERLVAYPTIIWLLSFGGYLLSSKE